MSNAPSILDEFGTLCRGEHQHEPFPNNRVADAAVYPSGLCRAICRGLVREIEMVRDKVRKLLVINGAELVGELPETEEDPEYWLGSCEEG